MESPRREYLNPKQTVMLAIHWTDPLRILLVLASMLSFCGASMPAACAQEEMEKVPDARQTRPEKISKVIIIEFEGEITYERESYFKSRFRKAESQGCDVLIVEIDSPGGLKDQSLNMARLIRDCDWAYTVVFVKNEAISGGALMSLGCDELFISPNASFGDIGEIGFDTEEFAWRLIEPKIESYLSRKARDLAESKGRSPDLAESMVDKDVLVFTRAGDDGKPEFKLTRADAQDQPGGDWIPVPEAGAERFLTLNGARAKQLGIAQKFATSRDEVLQTFDGGSTATVTVFRHNTSDSVAHFLNYPFISGLILLVGLIALYIEFSAPGIGVGGLVAMLCAMLFFWSHFAGGTAGWMEVILFVAGLVFILAEIFVIPGFGVAGVTGVLLLGASVILAGQSFVIPETELDWNQTLTTFLTLLGTGFAFLFLAFFLSGQLESLPFLSTMVLAADRLTSDEKVDTDDSFEDLGANEGDIGVAESLLRPSGRAIFNGRSFDVVSDGSFVEQGSQIKIIRVAGNRITVAKIEEDV